MMDHERIAMLELGIGQEAISSDELRNLVAHIDADLPLCLDGNVWDKARGCW